MPTTKFTCKYIKLIKIAVDSDGNNRKEDGRL